MSVEQKHVAGQVDALFDEADVDGSGTIEFEELKRVLREDGGDQSVAGKAAPAAGRGKRGGAGSASGRGRHGMARPPGAHAGAKPAGRRRSVVESMTDMTRAAFNSASRYSPLPKKA